MTCKELYDFLGKVDGLMVPVLLENNLNITPMLYFNDLAGEVKPATAIILLHSLHNYLFYNNKPDKPFMYSNLTLKKAELAEGYVVLRME